MTDRQSLSVTGMMLDSLVGRRAPVPEYNEEDFPDIPVVPEPPQPQEEEAPTRKPRPKFGKTIDGDGCGRFRLLERDGFRCIYCGCSAFEDFVTLQADHVVPLSLGGLNQMSNMATACSDCNLAKLNYLLPEALEASLLGEIHNRNMAFEIPQNAEYLPHVDRARSKRSYLNLRSK